MSRFYAAEAKKLEWVSSVQLVVVVWSLWVCSVPTWKLSQLMNYSWQVFVGDLDYLKKKNLRKSCEVFSANFSSNNGSRVIYKYMINKY